MARTRPRLRPRPGALVLLAALVLPLAYVGAAVFDAQAVLVGGDCLEVDPPWRGSGVAPWNPELGDHALAFVPYHSFLTDEWRDRGHLPAWNPYQFCGSPCLGNPQFGHWSVFGWLPYAFPRPDGRPLGLTGYELGAWVRLFLGAWFAYLLARALERSRPAACLTALAFGYGGYQVLWLNFPLSHVSTFLPMVLFFLTRGLRGGGPGWFAGAGAAFAVAVLGGHPETAFFVGVSSGLWVLAWTLGVAWVHERALRSPGPGRFPSRVWRRMRADGLLARALFGLGALAAGSALGAPSLLPFLEYLDHSLVADERTSRPMHHAPFPGPGARHLLLLVPFLGAVVGFVVLAHARAAVHRVGGAVLAGSCAWAVLFAAGPDLDLLPQFLVDPAWQGHPVRDRFLGRRTFLESNLHYVGVLTLALAVVGAGARRGFRGRLVCLLVACGSLAGLLQLPPWIQLIEAVPVLNLAEPSRAAGIGSLALALLAGAGLDRLVGCAGAGPASPERAPLAAVLAFVGLAAAFPVRGETHASEERAPQVHAAWQLPAAETQLAASDAFDLRVRWERPGDVRATYRLWHVEDPTRQREGLLLDSAHVPTVDPAEPRFLFAHQDARFLPPGSWQLEAEVRSPAGAFPDEVLPGPRIHVGRGVFETTSWGRAHVAIAVATCVLLAFAARARRGARWAWLALLPLAVDLHGFGRDWNGVSRKDLVYRPAPSLEFLADQLRRSREAGRGEFRVWTSSEILKGNAATAVRLRDLEGYDAIEVSHYRLLYRELLGRDAFRVGLAEANPDPSQLTVANFPVSAPIARAMGVRFVLDTRRYPEHVLRARGLRLAFPRPLDPDAPPVDGIWIYEVEGASGMRAYLAHHVVTAAEGTNEYFAAIARHDVTDPAHPGRGEISYIDRPDDHVLLDPGVELAALERPFTRGRVRFLRDEPDRVELAVEDLDGDAFLVLTDTDFPGWEATVDGRAAEVHRAFLAFRLVRLPPGTRRVTFRYAPPSLAHAVPIAMVGGLVLLAFALVAALRGFRARGARPVEV